jgi:SAM-dependent methyltransferase
MNWAMLRQVPWLDTRARFVARTPRHGALLDLGSSDGETLGHFAELRPDLRLFAVDKAGEPGKYPRTCEFQRADLERDALPWPDESMDAVTCLHVVEHLNDLNLLIAEAARLLKPGGRIYFETPHPKTLELRTPPGAKAEAFTFNFFDDPTHVRPVAVEDLARRSEALGLEIAGTGISRNWLFAAAWPFFAFLPPSRKKYTSQVHWIGWSAYAILRRPL